MKDNKVRLTFKSSGRYEKYYKVLRVKSTSKFYICECRDISSGRWEQYDNCTAAFKSRDMAEKKLREIAEVNGWFEIKIEPFCELYTEPFDNVRARVTLDEDLLLEIESRNLLTEDADIPFPFDEDMQRWMFENKFYIIHCDAYYNPILGIFEDFNDALNFYHMIRRKLNDTRIIATDNTIYWNLTLERFFPGEWRPYNDSSNWKISDGFAILAHSGKFKVEH